MDESLLADCVRRSSSLDSILDSSAETPLADDFNSEEFLAEWRDALDADFRDRPGFAGLTPEEARERFRTTTSETPEGEPAIPPAFETAEEVVDRAVELDAEAVRGLRERHPESPFVHLVAPLAAAASERVALDSEFASTARKSLVDWLFERLTTVSRHPLFIQFKAHQQTEYSDIDFEERTDSTAVYDEFVAEVRDADYEPLFETYPLLLELLGVVADQWRGAVARLDDRLAADRDLLGRTFGDDGDALGRIADVDPLSDDAHGDGEIVWGVHFESGASVVYKPRPVGGEEAFGTLLGWVSDRASVPDLARPTVADRGEYGWMEYVGHRPCEAPAGVERYYERMGAIAGLAFALGSTDFHRGNVVAAGDQPVVVDLETALAPGFDEARGPSSPAVSVLMDDSLLETSLLPFTNDVADEKPRRVTNNGLSRVDDVAVERESQTFVRPNTDAMDLRFRDEDRLDGTNLPRLDGEVCPASDHLGALKRGFREVAGAIRDHREELLGSDGLLGAFEECEVRYLLRPTRHYRSKLVECTYSSQLRSGVRRSVALESLYETFVPRAAADGGRGDGDGVGGNGDGVGGNGDGEGGDGDDCWKLVAAEKAALRRFAVPRFTVPATGRELRDGRGESRGVLADRTPLARARQRVAALDQHRIDTQLHLLDIAFDGPSVPNPVSTPVVDRVSAVVGGVTAEQGPTVSDVDATEKSPVAPATVAANVAAKFGETATEYPDGSLRWGELVSSPGDDPLGIREPKLNLYEGYAGVGLFLAAAAVVLGDDSLADRSRRVFESVRSAFADGDPDLGIGGTKGTGSVAYGLVCAGDLLGDDDLVARGRAVAGRTTREEIVADGNLDVMTGAAGELLAQLAVHERTGDEAALDRARWCGDRLLEAAVETGAGYRVPVLGGEAEAGDGRRESGAGGEAPKGGDDPRFGFAHGLGGVGTALARLGDATGDDEYARVGRDALRFDAELWCADDSQSETIWGWCNGAAGVGVGLLAVPEVARDESLDAALRDGLRTGLSVDDSLCCGSMGRALFMVEAGEELGDPTLVARGETLFADALERARREGRLRLGVSLPDLPEFGLFPGLAGVGYVALRLEARERDLDLPRVTRLA